MWQYIKENLERGSYLTKADFFFVEKKDGIMLPYINKTLTRSQLRTDILYLCFLCFAAQFSSTYSAALVEVNL